MRVAHREILFLESLDDYVRFHLANNKRIVARTTLKELETRLPNHTFTRVHKSYMASKTAIDSIRNKVIYIGEKSIPIGANYFEQVKNWYGVA
jgi:DNA-binding LytR/AlgR family response regulator